MAMVRYERSNPVAQLQHEINRVFGNLQDAESSGATSEWMPAVDVREFSDRFELLVDLPGVDPKKVEITLDKGMLSLSGERGDKPRSDGPAQQERSERRLGRFYRRFMLPDTVDGEKVKATGSDGVLEIVIPKQPKAQPRRISVNT